MIVVDRKKHLTPNRRRTAFSIFSGRDYENHQGFVARILKLFIEKYCAFYLPQHLAAEQVID
jgi:hypothetical protein